MINTTLPPSIVKIMTAQSQDHGKTSRFFAQTLDNYAYTPSCKRESEEEHFVTAFLFRVRNVPAALYKAMGGFATNGVNMTKLESYMVEGSFTATQFYAEVDGHPDDRNLQLALEELGFFSSRVDVLGVFRAHPYRQTGVHDD